MPNNNVLELEFFNNKKQMQNIYYLFVGIVVLFLFSGCYNATDRTRYADTQLMWAAKNGDVKSVKILLEKSPDINERHSVTGETPLIYASKKNHANIVALLIRHDADKNIRDNMGNSALDWASRNGNKDIIEILLKKDLSAKDNQQDVTALVSAIYSGKLNTAIYLIEEGVSVNGHDSYGDTPFIAAIKIGNAEIISYLLKQGANARATDKMGRSSLMLASQAGHIEIVSDLIKQGSDINRKSTKGFTALMFASANAQAGIVQFLLEQGANPNLRDKEGNSTIYLAAANKRWFIEELLLDAGADLSLEQVEEINKNPYVTAPMYGVAGKYYLNRNNREKAIKYYELSEKSYINLSKKYKGQANNEAIKEVFSLIGKALLLTTVAVGEEYNARMQARQQSQLAALTSKPKGYTEYSRRVSSNYPKYYRINRLAAEVRMQQYSEWMVSDSLSGQSADRKKAIYNRNSAWAATKAKNIGLTLSCVRESSEINIKTCN